VAAGDLHPDYLDVNQKAIDSQAKLLKKADIGVPGVKGVQETRFTRVGGR
jgi:hypothetical protein